MAVSSVDQRLSQLLMEHGIPLEVHPKNGCIKVWLEQHHAKDEYYTDCISTDADYKSDGKSNPLRHHKSGKTLRLVFDGTYVVVIRNFGDGSAHIIKVIVRLRYNKRELTRQIENIVNRPTYR